jgi:glycosyltransferase involved in cell wall biosynthesis
MNVIFLTLVRINDIEERGIYQDLMRKFRDEGHQVYIVTAAERRLGQETSLVDSHGVKILNVKTLNVQKTNIVEKGIGTLLIESQFKAAIKKYLGDVKFELITYSTPPITFTNVVKYLKQQNAQAVSYLQLKDIFPQNAVDIGMMSTTGVKGLLYKFFHRKEKKLYAFSDYIGCMSPANVEFVLKHNPEVDAKRVEVAPNSLELKAYSLQDGQEKAERYYTRKKYNLPTDKPIFIYGGNLGKPQGIDYLIKCLDAVKGRTDCHFVVVGTGTELPKLQEWYDSNLSRIRELENGSSASTNSTNHTNVTVMKGLPKEDYDMLVKYCDVGLIFLDHRFTIPNYPSRLLSYLEYKMPVVCATDVNTDIGKIAEENGYGYWCESVNPEDFTALVDKMLAADRKAMGEKGYEFLKENYTVENTYNAIMKHIKN